MAGLDVAELLNILVTMGAALLLVVLIGAVVGFGLKLLTHLWQNQVMQLTAQIETLLDAAKLAIDTIEHGAKTFPATDPEPYRTLAVSLHRRLSPLRYEQSALKAQLKRLVEQTESEPNSFWARLIFSYWQHPRYWRSRLHEFKVLHKRSEALITETEETKDVLQALHDLPLTVAKQARALDQATTQSQNIGYALRTLKVRGSTLDAALTKAQNLQDDLKEIPAYFLSGSDRIVWGAAQEDTISTWEIIQYLREPIEKLLQQFKQWQSNAQFLGKTIPDNTTLLDQVATRMAEARQGAPYPMDWEHFNSKYHELYHSHTAIVNSNTERTPELLNEHAVKVGDLDKRLKRLHGQVISACATRLELLPLLENEDLAPQPTWFTQAQTLGDQVKKYDVINWWELKSATKIPDDAKNLAERQKKWVPARREDPLLVTKLSDMLTHLPPLIEDLAAFKIRLQQVDKALTDLNEAEKSAGKDLEITRQALDNLIHHMQETKYPFNSKVAKYQPKLKNLHKGNRNRDKDLKNQMRGAVKDKIKRVNKWFKSCQKTLQPLPPLLQEEIRAVEVELRDLVEARPDSIPLNKNKITPALATERPAQLPGPPKKMKLEVERTIFYANQIDTQLQDRENLYALLKDVTAQLEELREK